MESVRGSGLTSLTLNTSPVGQVTLLLTPYGQHSDLVLVERSSPKAVPLSGYRPGQVWVVTGMPGQGRTTLAVQWTALLSVEHE